MRVSTGVSGDMFERRFVWPDVRTLIERAQRAEDLGFDSLSIVGGAHDPFVNLAIAAEHTSRIHLLPNVAIAFGRTPMHMAESAWDVQRISGGRFILGLGTQVRSHNERRYSAPWVGPPGPRLREYILCMRAIFETFKNPRAPTYYKGEYYQFTLITPFFNAGPIPHPYVPIYVACLNTYNARTGGQYGDGLVPHALCTPEYIKARILPAVEAGAKKSGRQLSDIDIMAGGLIVTGKDKEEVEEGKWAMRVHLGFYGSTPTYRPALEFHGWGELADRLHQMSKEGDRRGAWRAMAELIPDDFLETWAIIGTYEEIVPKIKERWGGILTATTLPSKMYEDREQEKRVRNVIEELHKT